MRGPIDWMRNILLKDIPGMLASALPIRQVPNHVTRCGFTRSSVSGLLSDHMTELCVGAGMSSAQINGELNVVAGTGANEEWLAMSNAEFTAGIIAILAQRHSTRQVNNNFGFFLADLIGQGLSYVVNSATSITVSAVPGNWTNGTAHAGQKINISCVASLAGAIPGRYAIASVANADGLTADITFTVSGWPGSGSGQCTLWGHSQIKLQANNATTTNVAHSASDEGWDVADAQCTTNATTTNHVMRLKYDGTITEVEDTVATNGTGSWSSRGGFPVSVPKPEKTLRIFLQALNGSVAPVGSATWFVGHWIAEEVPYNKVIISSNVRSSQQFVSLVSNAVTSTKSLTTNTDTSTNLGASATYTGSTRDLGTTNSTPSVRIGILHTAGNEPGHLVVQCDDASFTGREILRVPIPSDGLMRVFTFSIPNRYWRALFVNGATAQTAMKLYTQYLKDATVHEVSDFLRYLVSTTNVANGASSNGWALNLGNNERWKTIRAMINSNQSGSLTHQQSPDGTNWITTKTTAVTGGTPVVVDDLIICQYVRTVFTNTGGSTTTTFRHEQAILG